MEIPIIQDEIWHSDLGLEQVSIQYIVVSMYTTVVQ